MTARVRMMARREVRHRLSIALKGRGRGSLGKTLVVTALLAASVAGREAWALEDCSKWNGSFQTECNLRNCRERHDCNDVYMTTTYPWGGQVTRNLSQEAREEQEKVELEKRVQQLKAEAAERESEAAVTQIITEALLREQLEQREQLERLEHQLQEQKQEKEW